MQQLYDAVRAAGADNLVVIGGLDVGVRSERRSGQPRSAGYNILYATHPYNNNPASKGPPASTRPGVSSPRPIP